MEINTKQKLMLFSLNISTNFLIYKDNFGDQCHNNIKSYSIRELKFLNTMKYV